MTDITATKTRNTTITILRVTENGDGFATTDDGQKVYVSPSLVARYKIGEAERRQARLLQNDEKNIERGVPWRAFYVSPTPVEEDGVLVETPAVPEVCLSAPEEDLQTPEEILEDEIDRRRVITTTHAAEVLSVSSVQARRVLDRLHRHNVVVRADVYATPTQTKASRAIWARSERDLTPLEGDDE